MSKLSYLVSTYDSGAYLDKHIQDLIDNQTDPDFEIIVVNPNSPGTDHLVAEKWKSKDDRVKYIYYNQRETYGSSWLRAWAAATSPIVMNSNTDDFHAPETTNFVSRAFEFVKEPFYKGDREVAFIYGGLTIVDESAKVVGRGLKPLFDYDVMSRECWAGPQVAWRNDQSFLNKLDWSLMEKRAAEYSSAFDYWLWLYFLSLGYGAYVIPQLITIYTQRQDSIENKNKWLNNYQTYRSIAEFFPHNFDNHLKHAKEFQDFENPPPLDEWIDCMQRGDKWKG